MLRLRLLLLLCFALAASSAQDGGSETSAAEEARSTTIPKSPDVDDEKKTDDSDAAKATTENQKQQEVKDGFDVENEDWGSYYDPQNVFCGKYDCYKILGFDYESFGKVKPSTKEITKRYRQLSREWHPDKSKHRNAKARFVKIARAYEVLTSKEQRAEYDFMRYNQDAYFSKYGTSVLWSYAPKSDLTLVVLVLLIIGNVFSWYSQKHRWQLVADRLVKAAVEDWVPRDGGTPESKQLREEALLVLAQEENESKGGGDDNNKTDGTASATKPKKKTKKVSGKERKRQEQDALLPIVTDLVNAMDDFGGGFHKPTYRDLLIVKMVKMPVVVTKGVTWQLGYWIRRLQKKELTDEERSVLTERAVGPVIWNTTSEEDRTDMVSRELWIKDNFYEWQEEQEIQKLSASEQKYIMKMKKKGKLDKVE